MDDHIKNILKPSNVTNIQHCQKKQNKNITKEEYLAQWEESLKKKEYQLDLKNQQLKSLSKQIQVQSELLVKQKLELQEKMDKYTKLLETIVTNQNTERLFKSNSFNLNSCKNRSMRSKDSLNDCQNRVANLLTTIRSASSFVKTPQQSYFAQNNNEYEEILFSKRNQNQSEIQVEQQCIYSRRNENQSFENAVVNHQQELIQLEQNQKQFYQKVYEEMNKLKRK